MTPQEWAEKLTYDLAFAAPEMHLTHIVRRLAEAMDDGAQQELERLRALLMEYEVQSAKAWEAGFNSTTESALAYGALRAAILAEPEETP